jgi:hypothetical protein
MHPDLVPFSIEEIEDGMSVRKNNRPYWNGYPTLLTVRLPYEHLIELVDELTGEVNEKLIPEQFVHVVQYGGLIILTETGT